MTMKYTALAGGLDMVSPSNVIAPGRLLFCQNYECAIEGGYRSIKGYLDLGEVPGEGPILGVACFDDQRLAIRKQVGVSTASLFKLVSDTWTLVGGGMEVGRYSFDEYTFKATSYFNALYMVGGGKPWKYDGTTLTQITSAPSGAQWLKCHNFHLFLGFSAGSIQHSAVGDPGDWSTGAGEIGVSDTLNGLSSTAGGVLIAFCKNSIQALYGENFDNFQLKRLTSNAGARPWTVTDMVVPFFVSDRGISNLQTVQAFGDFTPMALSRSVDPIFSAGFTPSASIANKTKNQYRVFEKSGRGVYLTTYGTDIIGATLVQFPHSIECAYSTEDESGIECSLFGSTEGRVYHLDRADSFAGENIVSVMTTAFNTMRSPIVRKRFRRVFVDIQSPDAISFTVLPQFNSGDSDIARHRAYTLTNSGIGGFWGIANWSEFVWSGRIHERQPIAIAGTAASIALTFSTTRNGTPPHVITGYTAHYDERRIERG